MANHSYKCFASIGFTIRAQFSHDDAYLSYLFDDVTTLFEFSAVSLGDLQQIIISLYNFSSGHDKIPVSVFLDAFRHTG